MGEALFGAIYSAVNGSAYETLGGIIGIAVVGVVVGSIQWLVLRGQVRQAGQWILYSAVGIAAGVVVSQWLDLLDINIAPAVELDELLAGAAFGMMVGTAQQFALGQWIIRACWWIPANILGGASSFFIGGLIARPLRVNFPEIPTAIVIGTLYGMVTGATLVVGLRKPASDESA